MGDQAVTALDEASALQTADLVRRGEVAALEVCDAAIARIEARDGPINAVVLRDFDRAREAARAIDASRRSDDPRPLLGVPMTLKESHDVAGLPSSWGIEGFRRNMPARDGATTARLKAAGAVILGKTNVPPELADWQAANPIYGRTVNPFDPTRTPGGSSGGAAAALATRMIPLEIGSDIGGSIRIPAHMCGVFGHKPSFGIVPRDGHDFPGTDSASVPLAVVGPMARATADLAATLDVIAGPLDDSPYRLALPRAPLKERRALRVLAITEHPCAGVDAPVAGAIETLLRALEAEGMTVIRSHEALPDLEAAHEAYWTMLMTALTRGAPMPDVLDAYGWMALEDEQMRVTRAWRALFDQVDVAIAPVFGTTAFPHQAAPSWADRTLTINGEETSFGAQVAWSGMALFAGLPATAAPIGVDAQGLPIGVQILSAPYRDHTTIAFAALLETLGLAAPAPNPVA